MSIVWSVALPEPEAAWLGGPVVTDGLVIAETGPSLTAYDLSSGRTAWKTRLKSNGRSIGAENVVVAGGRAFTAGADSVYAVEATTGRRLWAFLPDEQAALCQITADEQAVYIGTRSHRVYALRADSGTVLWSVDVLPQAPYLALVSGIARSGDTLYASVTQFLNQAGGFRTGLVIALDRLSGAELWRYVGPDDHNDATRAGRVAGNYLLVPSVYAREPYAGSFFALDRFSGQQVWRVPTHGIGPAQAPLESGGVVYVGGGDGWVYAVALSDGRARWTYDTGGAVDNVALCGVQLLVNNLELRILDPASGRQVQSLLDAGDSNFPTSGFAVSGNRAFVVGNTAAYGLSCSN